MTTIVNNFNELCDEVGCARSHPALRKAIYKGTDCGAWIKVNDKSVTLGSIVEGSDAEIGPYTITFPFDATTFWETLNFIDGEAGREWYAVNSEGEGLDCPSVL